MWQIKTQHTLPPTYRRRLVHNNSREQLRLWSCSFQVVAVLLPNLSGNNKFLGSPCRRSLPSLFLKVTV